MNKKDLTEKLESVSEMLKKGIVIAFIHPETFNKIKDKLSQIQIHENLKFMEVDKIEKGTIVFAEKPRMDAFFSPFHENLKFMEVDKIEKGTIVFAEKPRMDAFFSPLFTEL